MSFSYVTFGTPPPIYAITPIDEQIRHRLGQGLPAAELNCVQEKTP